MSDRDIMLIDFGCFLSSSWPSLFTAEGADIKSACTRGVCIRNTCVGGVDVVKHLEIYLQSF